VGGPLAGLRVLEFAARAAAPLTAMMLADMGAEVLRIDRIPKGEEPGYDPVCRSRRSLALDLRHPDAAPLVLALVERADVLVEGMRPGVAERLGIGPDACWLHNPRLVYARVTGYGQTGPNARMPGHVINYAAVSGALHVMGRTGEKPVVPIDLVGGSGAGVGAAFGILCAVFEARRSGRGQVVDANCVDDAALLTTSLHAQIAADTWRMERGTNIIDSGAHFYEVYETADDRYVAVGAAEPQFYRTLIELLGVADDPALPPQMDRDRWPHAKEIFARAFRTRTRDEWCALFAGKDVCVSPVLTRAEAPTHEHLCARATFVDHAGVTQPAPAPRFSRTPAALDLPAPKPGEHTDEVLGDWGIDAGTIADLHAKGAIY
jgi:alpha-methylacyl-CoA racemase